jgi:hypothetical protein
MGDDIAMGYTLTLAGRVDESVVNRSGSGQGDLMNALAKTPLAQEVYWDKKNRKLRMDAKYLCRFDGTDYCQWIGRCADGYYRHFGPVFHIIRVQPTTTPPTEAGAKR